MDQRGNRLKGEKGIAVPFVAVALMAIIGMTALGVETARLAAVATEVQSAAEIGATAGARHVLSSASGTPRQHALDVLARNTIDGTVVASSHLTALEVGNYSEEGGFVFNLQPFNAVRAQVEYTVDNILFAGLGVPTSHVTKIAVAAFQPTAGGRPTVPIAIGECLLNEGCLEDSCQPFLRQVPDPNDNSAWTGFFDVASTNQIAAYFPPVCVEGTASVAPYLRVGDAINLINGQSVPLLGQVQCMLDNGLTEVLVPVVPCDTTLNQAREVRGFARFRIVAVHQTGKKKGIDIQGLVSASDNPGGSAQTYGAGTVAMVQ